MLQKVTNSFIPMCGVLNPTDRAGNSMRLEVKIWMCL